MNISDLIFAAKEALAGLESAGGAMATVTVEATRDDSGWISYDSTALVTYHDGETTVLDICGTPLSVALEKHADDEAELGSLPTVVIPIAHL